MSIKIKKEVVFVVEFITQKGYKVLDICALYKVI